MPGIPTLRKFCRSSPGGLLLFVVSLLAAPLWVAAQTPTDITKQQIHDHKQCTSTCQIELDRQLLLCPEYRDESNDIDVQQCRLGVRGRYEKCVGMCPADPRRD